MPNNSALDQEKLWSRRQLIKLGLTGAGVTSVAALWHLLNSQTQLKVRVPSVEMEVTAGVANPMKMLREFDYGTLKQENGRTIREFQLNLVHVESWSFVTHRTILSFRSGD